MKLKEKKKLGLKGVPNAFIDECELIIDLLKLRTLTPEQVIETLKYAPLKRFWCICRMLSIKVD